MKFLKRMIRVIEIFTIGVGSATTIIIIVLVAEALTSALRWKFIYKPLVQKEIKSMVWDTALKEKELDVFVKQPLHKRK